uniref:Protein kinase domain-containing protein n=1 Tax=Strigops habroptila TaxID=2489341 RepID=A0A672UZH9_STRHB
MSHTAGAGEPACGWAREADPCPGPRRALWGTRLAAVGVQDPLPQCTPLQPSVPASLGTTPSCTPSAPPITCLPCTPRPPFLHRSSPRTASCQAQGHVTCVTLAKDLRQSPLPARLEDLEAVRYKEGPWQGQHVVLGTGGFGRVELVRAGPCEHLFALKRIRKDWVVRTRQQEHVRTERRVLASCRSPFIVGFFGTFRDAQYVYLLLEFCQGGELWTKLREVRCFEEPLAVFCCACVVEGLEYLHGHGIVYRDLKPENLMLDQRGYVKLVDFGFAKELQRGEKSFSFCGTHEYLAPEMLRQEGHDFAVDFWMLGVLTFELLVGRPPFHSADPRQTYSRILDGIFSFPAFLSEAACSIIGKLCAHPAAHPGSELGAGGHCWGGTGGAGSDPVSPCQGPPYVNFKRFSVDWTPAEDEFSGWDEDF